MEDVTTLDAEFDARWTAWQQRGQVQARALRHRLQILLPALAIIVTAAYLLLLR